MPQSVEVISAETILGPDQTDSLGLARRALEAGRLDEAERLYTALLGSGAAADGHKGIGDVLLRQNRLPRAAQAYIAALKLRPDWPEAGCM